ncbi:MAG: tyrosine decarboxylase MfnA [Candidatus Heimdallarchaeota archaeon]
MSYLKEVQTIADLFKELRVLLGGEASYNQVLSSMCTLPPDIAREIASKYAAINLGDPGLFPQTVQLEKEVLNHLSKLVNAPVNWSGTITSGGSESNLIGCWAARNWSRKVKGINNGKIIFPKSAHVSFEKAADILNLNSDWVSLTEDYQVDIESVKQSIDENTVGIVGIAGTTGIGICDDIKALSDLAIDHELFLHVDAAYGGTIFPYLDKLGYNSPSFGFENEGVMSVSLDTHKILGSLIPGGSIILRSKEIVETISKNISYLSDSSTKQFTITGTRPGTTVVASWVLLQKMGESYILERIRESLEVTQYLVQKLKVTQKIELVFDPTINIVGFTNTKMQNVDLVKELEKKGWHLSIYSNWIRIVVMPHVTKETIDNFIKDLEILLLGD